MSVRGGQAADQSTGAGVSIESEHSEIHEGNHFFVAGFATVDSGNTKVFSVLAPASGPEIHMTFEIVGTSQTEVEIRENATVTGGTAASPVNNDRNSSNTSQATIKEDPTVTVAGDLLYQASRGVAGNALSEEEGPHDRSHEIILKKGATTTFKITSRDNGNIISYEGKWYEHTPKG